MADEAKGEVPATKPAPVPPPPKPGDHVITVPTGSLISKGQ